MERAGSVRTEAAGACSGERVRRCWRVKHAGSLSHVHTSCERINGKNKAARGQVVAGKNDEKKKAEEEKAVEASGRGAGADGSQRRKRKVVRL